MSIFLHPKEKQKSKKGVTSPLNKIIKEFLDLKSRKGKFGSYFQTANNISCDKQKEKLFSPNSCNSAIFINKKIPEKSFTIKFSLTEPTISKIPKKNCLISIKLHFTVFYTFLSGGKNLHKSTHQRCFIVIFTVQLLTLTKNYGFSREKRKNVVMTEKSFPLHKKKRKIISEKIIKNNFFN